MTVAKRRMKLELSAAAAGKSNETVCHPAVAAEKVAISCQVKPEYQCTMRLYPGSSTGSTYENDSSMSL